MPPSRSAGSLRLIWHGKAGCHVGCIGATFAYNFIARQHADVIQFILNCLNNQRLNPAFLPLPHRDQAANPQEHDRRHRRGLHRWQGLPHAASGAADTGIVFRRVDLQQAAEIKADPYASGRYRLSSCLEKNGERISTVEHLMSAFAGLGIDKR